MTGRAGVRAAPLVGGWAGLLGRYAAVFGWAWRQRHAGEGASHTADERAFLPAALSLQETPVHPAPRCTAWLLMGLFVFAVAWAWFGRVDIVAVAPGRIIVGERSKVIQPLERSVVRQVLVRDGDHVLPGQALVELDPTNAVADKAGLLAQLTVAAAEALGAGMLRQALAQPRLLAPQWPHRPEHDAAAPALAEAITRNGESLAHLRRLAFPAAERVAAAAQMDAEWRDIVARLDRFAAEDRRRQAETATVRETIAKLELTLPMARKREDDFKALSAQGFIANHAGQDRTRERLELERDLVTQRARLLESVAAATEGQAARAAYLAETRRALAQREAQSRLLLRQALHGWTKAAQREKQMVLTAPVAGVVQQLATHTPGGVVTEAQPLMVIVPDEAPGTPVVAEVTLENKDIGFVRAGQVAEVKFETFAYTRYGTVPAKVQLVTADAVGDDRRGAVFPARLLLDASRMDVDGRQIRLSPGMNVTAEIKTGRRRVIEYLLSPIQRAGREGLRER